MVDYIKAVLALSAFPLLATCQVHIDSCSLETLTHKGNTVFVNACLLMFELQPLHNPGVYPIPLRIGIIAR